MLIYISRSPAYLHVALAGRGPAHKPQGVLRRVRAVFLVRVIAAVVSAVTARGQVDTAHVVALEAEWGAGGC